MDEKLFKKKNIKIEWFNYEQELKRLSIIDYLFNN